MLSILLGCKRIGSKEEDIAEGPATKRKTSEFLAEVALLFSE